MEEPEIKSKITEIAISLREQANSLDRMSKGLICLIGVLLLLGLAGFFYAEKLTTFETRKQFNKYASLTEELKKVLEAHPGSFGSLVPPEFNFNPTGVTIKDPFAVYAIGIDPPDVLVVAGDESDVQKLIAENPFGPLRNLDSEGENKYAFVSLSQAASFFQDVHPDLSVIDSQVAEFNQQVNDLLAPFYRLTNQGAVEPVAIQVSNEVPELINELSDIGERLKTEPLSVEELVSASLTRLGTAALLIFLVQILVSVYRYYARLSSCLRSRADMLDLYGTAEFENIDLVDFAKVFSSDSIDFGKNRYGPVNDLTELVNAISRSRAGT